MDGCSAPFVSIIIPVYNDSERLSLCLQALAQQTYAPECYEVIVVDNASSVSVEPLVKRFERTVFAHEARAGSYVARNKGIEVARGSIFAFTDSDCVPDAGWLAEGVRKLQETPGCGLVGGRIDLTYADESAPTTVEVYEAMWAFQQDAYVKKSGYSATANLLALREAFEKAGPFNADLKSGGDREWCNRARRAGYVLAYAEEAAVRHPARRTLKELSSKTMRISGGLYDRQRGNNKVKRLLQPLWGLRPPVKAMSHTWGERNFDRPTRLRVMGILLLMRWLTSWEQLRLLMGGKSRR